jgi:hypothetical protein
LVFHPALQRPGRNSSITGLIPNTAVTAFFIHKTFKRKI